jgi:hypothetical protein
MGQRGLFSPNTAEVVMDKRGYRLLPPLTRPAADLSQTGEVKDTVSSRSLVRPVPLNALAPFGERIGVRGPG